MDDQPGADLLGRAIVAKRPATTIGAVVAGLVVFTACPAAKQAPPPDLPAVGGLVVLLRIPSEGGAIEAYHPDSLRRPIWSGGAELPPIREVLGINPDTRLLMAVDGQANLVAIDLEARGIRQLGGRVASAAMAADGSVYTVDPDRRVSRFQAGLPSRYRTELPVPPVYQTGTLGNRYLAVLGTQPRQLVVLSPDEQLKSFDVAGGVATATRWADLVAVVGDQTISLYHTKEPFNVSTLRPSASATQAVFSPSGHRLYVAHADPELEVFDRYSQNRLATIQLPGTPSLLRVDATGRWLLAHAGDADSVWIVDLATGKLVGAAASDWTADLPTVAGASNLLTSLDGDLVSIDLSRAGLPEVNRLKGGAVDHWLVTGWLPRERKSMAAAAAESILVAQDSLLVPAADTAGPGEQLYLQVSHSQNPDWSREFATQLTGAGYPARVMDPGADDDGYRVVVGPYRSRNLAEEAGRKLDRPYFILVNPAIKQ